MKQRQRRHRLPTRRLFRPWSSSRFAMEQFFEEINRAKLTLQPRLDALAEELLNSLHLSESIVIGVKVADIDVQNIPLQKDPNEQ